MCVGEKRRLHIPPAMAFGRYGNNAGIPGFISVTMDIELKDHYPRIYTPYYSRRIEKEIQIRNHVEQLEQSVHDFDRKKKLLEEHPLANETESQKQKRRKEEEEIEKSRAELKEYQDMDAKLQPTNRNQWERNAELEKEFTFPYHYLKTEFLDTGLKGYSPSEREERQQKEDLDYKFHARFDERRRRGYAWERGYETEEKKRHQQADKFYNLTSMVIQKRHLIDASQKDPDNMKLRQFVSSLKDPVIRADKPIPLPLSEYRSKQFERLKEAEKKRNRKHRKGKKTQHEKVHTSAEKTSEIGNTEKPSEHSQHSEL